MASNGPMIGKKNHAMHLMYATQDIDTADAMASAELHSHGGAAQCALSTKAMAERIRGNVSASLSYLQQAQAYDARVWASVQAGHSLYLLGRLRESVHVFHEALTSFPPSGTSSEYWELLQRKGLAHLKLHEYHEAVECFQNANAVQPHEESFTCLGKAYTQLEDYRTAADCYCNALDLAQEDPDILTTLGILYLRLGENYRAFDHLGNALTHNPRNVQAILAAASMIQDHAEMDVALVKYRVAAVHSPNSPQLWNNIGMCFFGKSKHVAAIACLKRALYLDPFEWIVSYNLGLVHLHTHQFASAFHFLSASINLKPDFASSYMYLAIALANLDDFENACSAYEKAIEMDNDYLFSLNYATTLLNHNEVERAAEVFEDFTRIYSQLEDSKEVDQDVLDAKRHIEALLKDSHESESSP